MIGTSIHNDVLMKVNKAKFFSVIADEVTDIANQEELSLSLRYILDGFNCEVFVDFIHVDVERKTGQTLAHTTLAWLRSHGLPAMNLPGLCYNGASNMSGARAGCRALFQKEAWIVLGPNQLAVRKKRWN